MLQKIFHTINDTVTACVNSVNNSVTDCVDSVIDNTSRILPLSCQDLVKEKYRTQARIMVLWLGGVAAAQGAIVTGAYTFVGSVVGIPLASSLLSYGKKVEEGTDTLIHTASCVLPKRAQEAVRAHLFTPARVMLLWLGGVVTAQGALMARDDEPNPFTYSTTAVIGLPLLSCLVAKQDKATRFVSKLIGVRNPFSKEYRVMLLWMGTAAAAQGTKCVPLLPACAAPYAYSACGLVGVPLTSSLLTNVKEYTHDCYRELNLLRRVIALGATTLLGTAGALQAATLCPDDSHQQCASYYFWSTPLPLIGGLLVSRYLLSEARAERIQEETETSNIAGMQGRIRWLNSCIDRFDRFVSNHPALLQKCKEQLAAHPDHVAQVPPLPEGTPLELLEDETLQLQLARNTLEHQLAERIRFIQSNSRLMQEFAECFKHEHNRDFVGLLNGNGQGLLTDS